jgi:protein-tyrosine phosphatase
MAELGIGQIIDLREADEITAAPSLTEGLGAVTHVVPIIDRTQWHEPQMGPDYLPAVFQHFVDACGVSITNAVRLIARSGDESVLVHCTAGKDRTGIVIAVALDAVGVDRAEIAADFAQTQQNLSGEWLDAMRIKMRQTRDAAALAAAEITLSSTPELILGALERIDRTHGSSAGFLVAHGLEEQDLELLAEVLLEAPAATSAS